MSKPRLDDSHWTANASSMKTMHDCSAVDAEVATLRAELATAQREREELRLRLEAELQCANEKREWALAAEHERDQQRERADRLLAERNEARELVNRQSVALARAETRLADAARRPDSERVYADWEKTRADIRWVTAALRGEASGPNAALRKDDQRCSCSHPSYVHHQVLPTGEHTHCLTMCGCESFTVATASPATTDEG